MGWMTLAGRPRASALEAILSNSTSFTCGTVDISAAQLRCQEAGCPWPAWLEEFIQNYGELRVEWRTNPWPPNRMVVSVDAALDEPFTNVKYFSWKMGKTLLPIGSVSSTFDCLLLAEDGEILIGGDAGIQRIGKDFETALHTLLTGSWDKTFY